MEKPKGCFCPIHQSDFAKKVSLLAACPSISLPASRNLAFPPLGTQGGGQRGRSSAPSLLSGQGMRLGWPQQRACTVTLSSTGRECQGLSEPGKGKGFMSSGTLQTERVSSRLEVKKQICSHSTSPPSRFRRIEGPGVHRTTWRRALCPWAGCPRCLPAVAACPLG